MKAFVFAAGRGERMGELTTRLPKPLIPVAGKPLIFYTLEKIKSAGITNVVINVAYLGEKIIDAVGDGSKWGLSIQYSREPYPLETGGALYKALPLLADEPFITVNADVWSDFDLRVLTQSVLSPNERARLVMVDVPAEKKRGDFLLIDNQLAFIESNMENNNSSVKNNTYHAAKSLTFSGIALMDSALISGYPSVREKFPLVEVFKYFIEKGMLSGFYYSGEWRDIGTPQRLALLEKTLRQS